MENKGLDAAALRESLLDAALPNVPFDGWSDAVFQAAARDCGVPVALARAECPRGAADLAVAYHRRGDRKLREILASRDLSALRFRDRVSEAILARLSASDREVVRRGAALFALPQHAHLGPPLLWETADTIWTALGDTADDLNWYTKRATLAAVYGATVLYWLGDTSEGAAATKAFVDRRIGEVMSIEKLKARVRDNRVMSRVLSGPASILSRVRPPKAHRGGKA